MEQQPSRSGATPPSPPLLHLVLVRHAEAETNLVQAIGRNNHTPLTNKGKQQARKLGRFWCDKGVDFDYVFASEAVRAHETAKISCDEAGIKATIKVVPELVEIYRGVWEGLPAHQVFYGSILEAYLGDPYNFRAPGGESEKEVEERMHAFLQSAVMPLHHQFCQEEEQRLVEAAASSQDSECEHHQRVLKIAIFSHGCSLR